MNESDVNQNNLKKVIYKTISQTKSHYYTITNKNTPQMF